MYNAYEHLYGEKAYLNLIKHIKDNGDFRMDRTGTGTKAIFGTHLRFDLKKGFPILTTKKVAYRLVVSELLWFMKGRTDLRYLIERNNHIWDEWGFQKWIESDEYNGPDMTDFGNRCLVDKEFNKIYQEELKKYLDRILTDDEFSAKYGDLGDVYGRQWRAWEDSDGNTIDQLSQIIHDIKHNPTSRRLLINAWNVGKLNNMALPPCHYTFQFFIQEGKYLSLQFNMRSVDTFLGLPFNIASYATLVHIIAAYCGLEVGELIFNGGDTHVYANHFEQVEEQCSREILELPRLEVNIEGKDIFELDESDIKLIGYKSHPPIKAPIAV